LRVRVSAATSRPAAAHQIPQVAVLPPRTDSSSWMVLREQCSLHATKRPPKGGLFVALLGAGDPAARRVHRGKHIIIRRSHRYALPQGGRGDEVAGHSFRTGRPCSQPSRTHGPNGALWQPGPQPSAAMAVPVIANMIKQHPRRAGRRIIVEAPIDLRDQPGNASGSPGPECQP
jgi:hypothetical protein